MRTASCAVQYCHRGHQLESDCWSNNFGSSTPAVLDYIADDFGCNMSRVACIFLLTSCNTIGGNRMRYTLTNLFEPSHLDLATIAA